MTSDPAAYLIEALDIMQRGALKSTNVDWNAIRTEALARIEHATTTAETYPTLRWVLTRLGDRHSLFRSPQGTARDATCATSIGLQVVYPEGVIVAVDEQSPAQQAGLHMRDVIEAVNGAPRSQLDRASFTQTLARMPLSLAVKQPGSKDLLNVTLEEIPYTLKILPHGRQWAPGIGYLDLPGVSGSEAMLQAYAEATQNLIRDMDAAGTNRWILDLRRNDGGDMWAMLAGVSSLLGEGECGFFVLPDGTHKSWLPTLENQTRRLLTEPYHPTHPVQAIAVLTSRLTCSAGEFTALAFRGHPQARSFGEPTAGLPTANQRIVLRDGARLFLTVALGADRTGQAYASLIEPDELVTSDWTVLQREQDPVMLAAVEWLRK